jgi:uncharacterized protein (TIGR03084 family)
MVDSSHYRALLDDLRQESDELSAMLSGMDDRAWGTTTPSPGWSIKDQVVHLAALDELATLSISQPGEFETRARALDDHPHPNDYLVLQYRERSGRDILRWFDDARATLLATAGGISPGTRLPWFGPSMSAASSMTARLMETWAHGLDVADTLGIRPEPTARLRHIAHLGVSTVGWSYVLHGETAPASAWRFELEAPSGETWVWGPERASASVSGPALDFCLLVTQRRNRADLHLTATGDADHFLNIAQAFAGEPGQGRASRQ